MRTKSNTGHFGPALSGSLGASGGNVNKQLRRGSRDGINDRKGHTMQTTLKIDDDVLLAAQQLADRNGLAIDQIISDMARRGMGMSAYISQRNGIPVLIRPGAQIVTVEMVDALRDEDYDYFSGDAGDK
jgi:antitoxin component of RelBE/YafQ-DinJ toxin-antitoxin module